MTDYPGRGATETLRHPQPTRPYASSMRPARGLANLVKPAGVALVAVTPLIFAALVVVAVNSKNGVANAPPAPVAAVAATASATQPPASAVKPSETPSAVAPRPRSYPPGASPAPRAVVDPESGLQAPVGPGRYRGGDTVTVGHYVTQGPAGTGEGCHYRLATDPDGSNLIASADNLTGQTAINVWPDLYLITRGCQPWRWTGQPVVPDETDQAPPLAPRPPQGSQPPPGAQPPPGSQPPPEARPSTP